MIRVNRSQRRFLEAVVRDNEATGSWFVITSEHFETSLEGAEIGIFCDKHKITFVLSYRNVSRMSFEMAQLPDAETGSVSRFLTRPPLETLQGEGFGDHIWRWSRRRGGYYAEVNPCPWCANTHIPIVTKSSASRILGEANKKGLLPDEP